MSTKVKTLIISMFIMLSVVSCLKTPDDDYPDPNENEIILPDKNEVFNTNTQNITVKNPVSISFSDGQTIVNNPYEKYGVTINVDQQNVTIYSTVLETKTEVNYVLSGIATAGFVKIYSDYKLGLVFNGVSIQNPTGAAVNIQSGKKISVTLVDKTLNRLIDEGIFQMTADEDMKGTFFSKGQLVFDGTGSLLIYGNYGHAICSDDFIEINNGNIIVNHAIKDGIHCNDYFQMEGGNIKILKAKSDGMECAKGHVTINGGSIEIESFSSGIKANGNMIVTGGEIYCNSGKNGIVSTEGAIVVTGGLIVASATKNVFDSGNNTFSITGGTAVGVGGTTTLPTANECRQRAVVWGASKFTEGQLISIKSSGDSDVLTFKLPKAYTSNMALIFTSPALQANKTYTIYKGGSVSGGSDFHGLYSGTVSSGGTAAATFTISDMVTTVGNVISGQGQ